MPSAAQIARERERVRRAVAWWLRKLGWSYDIRVMGATLAKAELQVSARYWPQDPKAFDIEIDAPSLQDLDSHQIRELVIHELGHILIWPVAEDATKGMTESARMEWVERVEEPVVTELARVLSRNVLGRWSQR